MQNFTLDKKAVAGVLGQRLVAAEGAAAGAVISAFIVMGAVTFTRGENLIPVWIGLGVFACAALGVVCFLRSKVENKSTEIAEIFKDWEAKQANGEVKLEFDPTRGVFLVKLMQKVDFGVGAAELVAVKQVEITREEAEAVRGVIFKGQVGGQLFLAPGRVPPAPSDIPAEANVTK